MKALLILAAFSTLTLSSCKSPEDTARLGRLTDLAITYAHQKGKLSDADLAAIREAATIILPPASDAKNPRADLQP